MRICKICGELESNHHEPDWITITMPEGCVCDFRTWDYKRKSFKTSPACAEYMGNGEENCKKCEHDKECHKTKP